MKKILIIIMLCGVTSSYAQVPPPPCAASTETWVIELDDGTIQIWSDYINLPECNKETIDGEVGGCHRAEGIYYAYTQAYAQSHVGELCPTPWRVPTPRDYYACVDLRKPGYGLFDFFNLPLYRLLEYSGLTNPKSIGYGKLDLLGDRDTGVIYELRIDQYTCHIIIRTTGFVRCVQSGQ
jgi:hypothetical protein